MKDPKIYTVGWICAISTEYVAARAFLDEEHDRPEIVSQNDNNSYTLGSIGRHNVVVAVLPEGDYGTNSAAAVARDMMHSFPNVRIGLMVGIGGGAPSSDHDIRLGDIVVSSPGGRTGSVWQYDYGKTIQDRKFHHSGFLDQPPTSLRTAVTNLKATYELKGHGIEVAIEHVLQQMPRLRKKYGRPDKASDRLFSSEYVHPTESSTSCEDNCNSDLSNIVVRRQRNEEEDDPAIYYGLIASVNSLMKNAVVRDTLAREHNVLCFEMEAAGLMNHFPCLVIRGICDYSDSHKNKQWQGYAAMTAAAYTKDLLHHIAPNRVEAEKKLGETLANS